MRVLFLILDPHHPATRYRVMQYLEYLSGHGVSPTVEKFPENYSGWKTLAARRPVPDAVVVQKKRLNWLVWRLVRKAGWKTIYDVDDAVMYASSRHRSPFSFTRMLRFKSMVRRSSAVIAGNAYLKSLAEPLNPNVHWLPTCMDLRRYPVRGADSGGRDASKGATVTVGWIGGRKSLPFVKSLTSVFDRLAESLPGLRLKIVCNEFFDATRIPIERKLWSEAEEAVDVAGFDINLAPLPDDHWSRGKCATKLLQGMAAGAASIASPVGAHQEIVQEGRNGTLARTPNEWQDKINLLARNPSIRAAFGAAGRATVEERYSLAVCAPKMLEILRKTVEGPR